MKNICGVGFLILTWLPFVAWAMYQHHSVWPLRHGLMRLQENIAFQQVWFRWYGSFCIMMHLPDWGAIVRADHSLLNNASQLRFLGAAARPVPRLRAAAGQGASATTSDIAEMASSFDEQIRPLLTAFGGYASQITASLSGHRVEIEILGAHKNEAMDNIVYLIDLAEKLMNWSQSQPFTLDASACRSCGGPDTDAECKRCRAPYHHACWQKLSGCHVWGCSSKRALLYMLEEQVQ